MCASAYLYRTAAVSVMSNIQWFLYTFIVQSIAGLGVKHTTNMHFHYISYIFFIIAGGKNGGKIVILT